MKREVEIFTLQQFEAAGGLTDGYSFEDFSCPLNKEVESYLRERAIHATHLGTPVTYLVYGKKSAALLGYFTLLMKPFHIEKSKISKTKCRMIERFAEVGEKTYTAAVYLIAQIGKNFAVAEPERIRGDELLSLAFEKLYGAKEFVGGKSNNS